MVAPYGANNIYMKTEIFIVMVAIEFIISLIAILIVEIIQMVLDQLIYQDLKQFLVLLGLFQEMIMMQDNLEEN